MSTDLRAALRDAAADEPPFLVDTRFIAHAGTRRIRRRTGLAVGTAALATAAVLVVTAVVSRPAKSPPDPAPAERVVRLDLDDAGGARPEVVARTRTTWRDVGRSSLEFDRLEGITADGLVLRSRYTNAHGRAELGLLDPATGATDWLPEPPWQSGEIAGVDLGADRLVVIARTGIFQYTTAIFDRGSRTWEASEVRLPGATEGHAPPRALVGADDRLYLGSTMEGQSGPMHWWSAPVTGGEDLRAEPDLEGAAVAWGDGGQVTAHTDGHVVLSTAEGDRVVGERRPDDCEVPASFPDSPVRVVLAGDRPVVTYYCDSGDPDVATPLTVVYGQDTLTRVEGATALVSDAHHLLVQGGRGGSPPLVTASTGETWLYLVDLDRGTVSRLGRGPHETQAGVAAGMVLWNSPGSLDDSSVYDVTWSVAPVG